MALEAHPYTPLKAHLPSLVGVKLKPLPEQ